jgi:hypothetical protein
MCCSYQTSVRTMAGIATSKTSSAIADQGRPIPGNAGREVAELESISSMRL